MVKGGIWDFVEMRPTNKALLSEIILRCPDRNTRILDLGCNVGRMLNALRDNGYTDLHGVDINATCEEYIDKYFKGLADMAHIRYLSFEDYLPQVEGNFFDVVFTHGATVEHVAPSFKLVNELCRVTKQFVIFGNVSLNGGSYPRFWEYEFGRCGFTVVKHLRPEKEWSPESEINRPKSLIVFASMDNFNV